ncbi:uncharacterized protein LOC107786374 isoform X4 [Nicotiana tabacum]|uniref:Uncharacterized protein LOC107786374 isoform X4 n=1 Tax=Nicotiana tabacum TaxID=4097 RepID=A0AC58SXC0_TOBAC
MDKTWMRCTDKLSNVYLKGVDDFLQFAFEHTELEGEIPCPCKKCNNVFHKTRDDVREHLIIFGIVKGYTRWFYHGEFASKEQRTNNDELRQEEVRNEQDNDIFDMIYDVAGPNIMDYSGGVKRKQVDTSEPDFEFSKLLDDAAQQLYPGCEQFSKLSLIVELFQIKCLFGLSDKATDSIMKLIKRALPSGETLPESFYGAKKLIRNLGLRYEKIHACENDCMLFWKHNAKAESCLVCGESRLKSVEGQKTNGETPRKNKNKVPRKVLRYFPLKPRLQRLFMSSEIASDMTWHHNQRLKDGVLRHPADSDAWKHFDASNPGFARDPRNVRLGLSSDGINPFGNLSVSHSTWPVIITVYNLPPCMCMKQPYCFLSLLIPGPKAPGNDIDVYLEPLIDELQELWYNGVNTYDASRKENFCMRAALLWTINDFPAYAYLSGWSTKGALACPSCNKETPSIRLKYGRKFSYMGARRFLSSNHKWRSNKRDFNGEVERRHAPKILSGDDILNQLASLDGFKFGKTQKKQRHGRDKATHNWRKKSIFFRLPYWKNNLIRHNLDVMHIEKNVCDNIIGTLLDMEGKTKDNLNARRDLKEMGIRRDLHPTQRDGKWYYPAACYTLSPEEKSKVCKFLKTIKVPDGYSSNLSRCVKVKDRKIYGLKSHDSHILLEQLLPFAIRGVVPNNVYAAITELGIFFRELCSKTVRVDVLDRLAAQIPITLSKLEKIFLPAFFDIMVHLIIHLPQEAKIAGPVQYRWMYPIERFLHKLKCYVRNRCRPEGSIAEGYIVEASLIFCSRYLHGSGRGYNPVDKNYEGDHAESCNGLSIFKQKGCPLLSDTSRILEEVERKQAHIYVLRNCEEVQPFLRGSPVHGVSDMVIGVLGGGKLGRMLCQAASQMALKVIVLEPMENCPQMH